VQTKLDILSDLYELLGECVGGNPALDEDMDLIGQLNLTSLKIMDLLMEIEDRFDVTVPLNRLSEVRTIGDLAAMLEGLVKGAPS
jgi:acyl carrier protein